MATGAVYPEIVEGGSPPPQNPSIWDALDVLRGGPHVPDDQVTDLLTNAKPDVDYPVLSEIPDVKSFSCVNVKQAGYYADTDFRYDKAFNKVPAIRMPSSKAFYTDWKWSRRTMRRK